MTSRTYASLDRNRMGPSLALDDAGFVVTTTAVCDINRTILGDLVAASGEFAYEVYFWSVLQASLANLISFGIAQPSVSLSGFVGGDQFGWGFRIAEGQIWNNNAVVATIDPQGERVPLGVHVKLSPTSATCDFLLGRTVLYTATLPLGKLWLPALSLGSNVAADLSAIVGFGLNRFDAVPYPLGWSQQVAGLSTYYLSLATEAFMSLGSDALPNQAFAPKLLNGTQLSITRAPVPWFHRSGGGRTNPASLATSTVDNSDGSFNALFGADAQNSPVVLSMVDSPSGGAGSFDKADPVFTGILDSVSGPNVSTASIVLRGPLARFDMPMPMRVIPPFYDKSSAGKVRPIGLGAQRNVQPVLLDEPTNLYLLADGALTNIAMAADGGAPLDPNALPPQFTPALNHEGLQLQAAPVFRLSVDCSSVGPQYDIPGADDVLNGDGAFASWTLGVPVHFAWTASAGSTLTRFINPAYAPTSTTARFTSTKAWLPTASIYGDSLRTTTQPLLGGRSYRLTMKLPYVYSADPGVGGARGGLMIRTALSNDPRDAVTSHGVAISTPSGPGFDYVVDFRVPAGAARDLYFIGVASYSIGTASPVGIGGAEIFDVRVELLGQYTSIPMQGITVHQAFTEILVNRLGEDPSVFNAADCDAIDAIYGGVLGLRWEDTPNVLDMLTLIADQYGAVLFEDDLGIIRIQQLTDPSVGTVVAAFAKANVDVNSIKRWTDTAPGLTTAFGGRINCTPFDATSDFVSDTATVPAGERAQYMAPSQYTYNSDIPLAQQYRSARGAPRNLLHFDDPTIVAFEGNRVNGMFTTLNNFISFDAYYDTLLGVGPSIAPQQLYFNQVFTFDIPEIGLSLQRMATYATEPDPVAKKITVTGWYS